MIKENNKIGSSIYSLLKECCTYLPEVASKITYGDVWEYIRKKTTLDYILSNDILYITDSSRSNDRNRIYSIWNTDRLCSYYATEFALRNFYHYKKKKDESTQ